MITVLWLPHFRAYSVRLNGRVIGLVRFQFPMPFRDIVEVV